MAQSSTCVDSDSAGSPTSTAPPQCPARAAPSHPGRKYDPGRAWAALSHCWRSGACTVLGIAVAKVCSVKRCGRALRFVGAGKGLLPPTPHSLPPRPPPPVPHPFAASPVPAPRPSHALLCVSAHADETNSWLAAEVGAGGEPVVYGDPPSQSSGRCVGNVCPLRSVQLHPSHCAVWHPNECCATMPCGNVPCVRGGNVIQVCAMSCDPPFADRPTRGHARKR